MKLPLRYSKTVCCFFLLAGLICLPACRQNLGVAEMQGAPVASLAASIADFEESILEWEQRVTSGEWSRMVADGSWTSLVKGDAATEDATTYPEKRIAEIRTRIDSLKNELVRREVQ